MGRPSRLSSSRLQTLLEGAPEAAVSRQQPKERSHKEIPQELLSSLTLTSEPGVGAQEGPPPWASMDLGQPAQMHRGAEPAAGGQNPVPSVVGGGAPVPGHGRACSGREWVKNITCTTSWPVVPCKAFPA